MRAHRSALLVVLAVLVGAGSASANDTVATVTSPEDLDAGQGLVVFSAYDDKIDRFRLMQLSKGVTSQVRVRPSPSPFAPDVGPTRGGRPMLAYERCASGSKRCDIFTFDPRTGKERRSPVSTKTGSERSASYWQGRIAFVRFTGRREEGYNVYLRAPGARRDRVLPSLPDRRCRLGRCVTVVGDVETLELRGTDLAQIFDTVDPSFNEQDGKPTGPTSIEDISELRLVNTRTGASKRVAAVTVGEAGRAFVGASLNAGRLYTYLGCSGADPSGCASGAGAFRYDLRTLARARAGSSRALAGFAVDGGRTYVLVTNREGGCGKDEFELEEGETDEAPCPILRLRPDPRYRSAPTR